MVPASSDHAGGGRRTLPPPGSLAGATARGALWSSVGRLGSQALQFVAGLVLARLLMPSDFGLVASVLVFTQFTQIFFDMGMGQALVQLKDLRQADLATVFWINALGGVVFAGLLTLAAPLIADFFGQPELTRLAPLVALGFTFNLGVVHLALLSRALRFRAIAIAEIGAALIGLTVSIVGALSGMGVYALGVGQVTQSLTMSVLLWSSIAWRPHGFVDRESIGRVWRFSGGMLGFSVVNFWGRNADNLLIGRFAGATQLGLYNRAYNLMTMPVQQVSSVLGRVMFPTMVAMGDDHPRVALAYRRALRVINALTVPVLAGIAVVSPALVPALWGQRWTPMVPLLAIVCLAGIPQCLGTSVGWIYQSQGRTGLMFRMGLVTSGLGVLAMVYAVQWGAIGVAWAVAIRAYVFSIPSLVVACRVIGLPAVRVLVDNAVTLVLSAVMAGLVWLVPPVLSSTRTGPGMLAVQVIVGTVVYCGGVLLFQRSLVGELRALAASRRKAVA